MIRVRVCDGIGTAGRTSGVIDPAVERLLHGLAARDIEAEAQWIDYSASMFRVVGGDKTWQESSDEAVAQLLADFRRHPEDKFVLMAYSGGNLPVHEFLDHHPQFHDRIVSVGFMSDPWRPNNKWQHGTRNPGGFGICGQDAGPIWDRSFWTSAWGDPISGADWDSLLRHLADVSKGGPDQIIHDAIIAFQQGNLQLARFLGLPIHQWFFGLGDRINRAGGEAYRYLTGFHTDHYVIPHMTSPDDARSLSERFGDTLSFAVQARI